MEEEYFVYQKIKKNIIKRYAKGFDMFMDNNEVKNERRHAKKFITTYLHLKFILNFL